MGVEEPMDNVGLEPAEGPSKSPQPHNLNDGINDLNTEKNVFFYALGYLSGTLTHQ